MSLVPSTTPPDTIEQIDVTPLKTGGRADWYVRLVDADNALPVSFTDSDIIKHLRVFFDKIDVEATARKDDPVAMVNALARLEALAADVRMVTSTVRQYAADALSVNKVRRLTVEDLATVEGTSDAERSEWKHQELLTAMLEAAKKDYINYDTGEKFRAHSHDSSELAAIILSWFRVQWRLTPIREAGLNPDDYSTVPTNEDGTPLRTPTVRMVDNVLRKA